MARKRGVYFFRRRLPHPLTGDVALSLQTRNFLQAEHRAAVLSAVFEDLISAAMKSDDLRPILREYLRERLERARERMLQTPYGQAAFVREANGAPATTDEALTTQLAILKRELRRRDPRSVEPVTRRVAEAHGVPPELHRELGLGLTQAHRQVLEQILQWAEEGVTPAIDLGPSEPAPAHSPRLANEGPLLSALLPNFVQLMVSTGEWTGQTKAQNEATFRMFAAHCGDRSVQSYTRRDLASFYDVLRQLPALYAKRSDLRGLTLRAIAEITRDEQVDRLTMKTVKRHFSALGRFFNHLRERGEYDGDNPGYGFEFPGAKRKASEARQMWEGEKLTKLFASPVWTGCHSAARRSRPGSLVLKDEKYWLPLLGLYHGNRLEEFAQLTRGDVRQSGDLWYFDINDEGAKQLKNEQSKRQVPLHPVLLALGFLNYIRETAQKPSDRLFPNLRPGGPDNKLGYYFSKWWSQYRRDIGLYEKGLDYHSFRGGVTTKLFAANVQEAHVDILTGHEGTTTSRKVYLKGLPLPVLYEAICKVRWPEVHLEVEVGMNH